MSNISVTLPKMRYGMKHVLLTFGCFWIILILAEFLPEHNFRLSSLILQYANGDRKEITIDAWARNIMRKTTFISMKNKSYLHGGVALHNFNFTIENPNLCLNNTKLFYFIYIYSAPDEFEGRHRIRETWGRLNMLKDVPGKMAFFLGRTKDLNVMKKVTKENDVHGDVILVDYMDSYTDLAHKSVMALKWMNMYCKSAKYYVKVDTDVLLNMFILKASIDKYLVKAQRTFLCYVWKDMIVVRTSSKWQVPKDQYQPYYYPTYCSGPMWIFTGDILKQLYLATFRIPFINVEDAYTSGLLPVAVGHVQHLDIPGLVEPFPHGAKLTRYKMPSPLPLGSVPEVEVFYQAWDAILDRLRDTDKQLLTSHYKEFLKSRKHIKPPT